eukprot:164906-Pyramimonas_sp.AAC.3
MGGKQRKEHERLVERDRVLVGQPLLKEKLAGLHLDAVADDGIVDHGGPHAPGRTKKTREADGRSMRTMRGGRRRRR